MYIKTHYFAIKCVILLLVLLSFHFSSDWFKCKGVKSKILSKTSMVKIFWDSPIDYNNVRKWGYFTLSNLCGLHVPGYTSEDVAAWSVRNVEWRYLECAAIPPGVRFQDQRRCLWYDLTCSVDPTDPKCVRLGLNRVTQRAQARR